MKTQVRPSTGIISVTIQTQNGERTVSTGTTDPKIAKQVIKAANVQSIEVMAKAGQLTESLIHKLTIGGSKTVDQVIVEWEQWMRSTFGSSRSADNAAYFAKAWARFAKVQKRRISDVKEDDISPWINAKDGNKLGTKRVMLSAVHSLFKFCTIREYSADPSRLVKIRANLLSHSDKEPRVKQCFTDAQVEAIATHLKERMSDQKLDKARRDTARFWYCATLIARYSGLRLGDICTLEWDCFAQPGKMIVWTDKRDARVELDMDRNLFRGVSAIPINTRKHCFPIQEKTYRGEQRSKLSVQFMRILEACKIEGHSFHDLRHTCATNLDKAGVNREAIAKILGHASTATTGGYIHD